MPATKHPTQPLHRQLLDGLTVKSRADGSVHTVKADGKTIAEVCVGVKATRLNLRANAKAPKSLTLTGKSKSWPGGGLVITDKNVAAARVLLAGIAKLPAPQFQSPSKHARAQGGEAE
jgi:hypothetical protein